jgi:hypothetical protein
MVEDVDDESWGGFGGATGFRFEGVEVFVVARNNPSALCLPIIIIDKNPQLRGDPFIGGNVATLACH